MRRSFSPIPRRPNTSNSCGLVVFLRTILPLTPQSISEASYPPPSLYGSKLSQYSQPNQLHSRLCLRSGRVISLLPLVFPGPVVALARPGSLATILSRKNLHRSPLTCRNSWPIITASPISSSSATHPLEVSHQGALHIRSRRRVRYIPLFQALLSPFTHKGHSSLSFGSYINFTPHISSHIYALRISRWGVLILNQSSAVISYSSRSGSSSRKFYQDHFARSPIPLKLGLEVLLIPESREALSLFSF